MERRAFLKTAGAGLAATALAGPFAPSIARAQALTIKLGTDMPVDHPLNVRLREAIDAIQKETNGKVTINLFPNNQLGSDTDMLSQIRSGAMEFGTFPSIVLSTLVPVAGMTGLGYAFTSYNQVWAAMDGNFGALIRRAIEKVNLVPFENIFDNGFRQVTTSTQPIKAPDDLKGLKIRVPVTPVWVSMFSAFGASPLSVPFSEAYSALQTKVADAQENALVLIDAAKLYEVQKFCSLTNHAWDGFWMLANGRVWKTVPTDVQQIMAKHFNAAAKKQRDDNERLAAELQKSLEAKGLAFNTVDVKAFQQALRATNFYPQWREKFGNEAWNTLQQYTGELG